MIIELHLLQSFPVSNLNRDDVGQPKSVTFGGVQRGRISSQCWKRSARGEFTKYGLDVSETGLRTKRLLADAARKLDGLDDDAEPAPGTADVVREALYELGFGVAKRDLTEYLLFVGREAGVELAKFAAEHRGEFADRADKRAKAVANAKDAAAAKRAKEKLPKVKPSKESLQQARDILDARRVADVALFGRMIADNKDFNVDAASQVAHALSTHPVVTEFDFYTAVDDLQPDDESGADMIGTVDFNAACYYRYANLDVAKLAENLGGDAELAERAANAWLRAFISATPSGKQNSTAARTTPEVLLTVVRDHGAWNLANAFLNPVLGTDLMAKSTDRMIEHFNRLRGFYDEEPIRAVTGAAVTGSLDLAESEQAASVGDLVRRTLAGALG